MYNAYQITSHGMDENGNERVALTLLVKCISDWEACSYFAPKVRIVGSANLREWALKNGLPLNPGIWQGQATNDAHSYWVGLPEIAGVPTSEAHLASVAGEPVIEAKQIVNNFHLKPCQLINNALRLAKAAS